MLDEIINFNVIHDLQMAANAGIDAIVVTCGTHSAALLQPYKPLACLAKTADLLDFLRGNLNDRKWRQDNSAK